MENWSVITEEGKIKVLKGEKVILTSEISLGDPDFKYIKLIAAGSLIIRILKMAHKKFYVMNEDDETAKLTKDVLKQLGFDDE